MGAFACHGCTGEGHMSGGDPVEGGGGGSTNTFTARQVNCADMETCDGGEDCEWYEIFPSECGQHDSSEFSAGNLCCECGATDECEENCEFYSADGGVCGNFDDAEFTASEECCECGNQTCAACDPCYPDGHGGSKVKPKFFVFQFVGGSTTDTTNDQGGKAYANGDTLTAGQSFQASCSAKGSPATVTINGDQKAVSDFSGADIECEVTQGGLKQTIGIHVSCSKNLLIGDQFGAIKLVDFYPLVHGQSALNECVPSNNGGNGGKGGKGGKGDATLGRRRQ